MAKDSAKKKVTAAAAKPDTKEAKNKKKTNVLKKKQEEAEAKKKAAAAAAIAKEEDDDLELESADLEEKEIAAPTPAQTKKDKKGSEFEEGASVVPISSQNDIKRKKREMKRKKLDADAGENRVVFISRLPKGFYEPQLRKFFSQFGRVIAVTLGRNPKTGKTRHFGFVEFARQDVAEIAAASMDRYLLAGHRLECTLADEGTVIRNTNFKKVPALGDHSRQEKYSAKAEAALAEKTEEKIVEGFQKKQEKIRKVLEEAGVKYDFPSLSLN